MENDGILRVKSPYAPRSFLNHIHKDPHQFVTLVCHRGAGKTVFAINDLIDGMLLDGKSTDSAAYIAPYKNQAKRNVWKMFKHYLSHIPQDLVFDGGFKLFLHDTDSRIELPNGSTIYILGADDPDSLRGLHFKQLVIDEVASMPSNFWTEVIRPTVTITKGKVKFIGTPQGDDLFKAMYDRGLGTDPLFDNWKSYMVTADDSGLLTEKEKAQLKSEMGEEHYNQEYNCSFKTANEGTFYGRSFKNLQEQNRIGKFEWNQNLPVTATFDIGVKDLTAIWFTQVVDKELVHIDYYQNTEENADFYVQILKARGYKFNELILPHDASKRTWGVGRSAVQDFEEAMRKHKLSGRVIIEPKFDVMTGINAVRSALSISKFNAARCELGIKALMNYRKKYNSKDGRYEESPIKSVYNHAADAFRYMAVAMKDITKDTQNIKVMDNKNYNPLLIKDTYNPFQVYDKDEVNIIKTLDN